MRPEQSKEFKSGVTGGTGDGNSHIAILCIKSTKRAITVRVDFSGDKKGLVSFRGDGLLLGHPLSAHPHRSARPRPRPLGLRSNRPGRTPAPPPRHRSQAVQCHRSPRRLDPRLWRGGVRRAVVLHGDGRTSHHELPDQPDHLWGPAALTYRRPLHLGSRGHHLKAPARPRIGWCRRGRARWSGPRPRVG